MIICDCPGFDDGDGKDVGTEIDISNGLLLSRSLRGCRTVNLVLIVPDISLGRGLALNHVIPKFLNMFVDNAKEVCHAVHLAITDRSNHNIEDQSNMLDGILNNM